MLGLWSCRTTTAILGGGTASASAAAGEEALRASQPLLEVAPLRSRNGKQFVRPTDRFLRRGT